MFFETCKVCGARDKTENMLKEEIYFKPQGWWCKKCFDKHCEKRSDWEGYHDIHLCCQDFMDVWGKYVHYNLPFPIHI